MEHSPALKIGELSSTGLGRSLRILMVVDLPWDGRLGACRVLMELADQWRAMGHDVDHFSLSEAFPDSQVSGARFALRQMVFARKVAAFLRTNRRKFDVIDAAIGSIPCSRHALGLRGIIVARSVGLYLLYDHFERTASERWPHSSRGTIAGRIFHGLVHRRLMQACDKSVRVADIINVPNKAEARCLQQNVRQKGKIIVQPYGLSNWCRKILLGRARSAKERLAERRVCFIGMWSARKGSYDWEPIVRRVQWEIPQARFRFLGTMTDTKTVQEDLPELAPQNLEIISEFRREDLPALLADCTVGAFPSYVEGFGLAVLEQLAAGLPTVAYDIPGPRDILNDTLPELLIPCGETERFAATLCRVLTLSLPVYTALSKKSIKATSLFSWEKIASDTISEYQALLDFGAARRKNGTGDVFF